MTDIPVGPVCHLPSPTVATSPNPQALPAIPPASPNIASLTATVNALRQSIIILAGLNGSPGPAGAPGSPGRQAPAGSWTQSDIQTSKTKIYQNDDPSTGNFVEVQRIDSLTFSNKTTKQTIVFKRPPDPDGT